ncbi:unnamed protein product [Rhodiola kirilowii]
MITNHKLKNDPKLQIYRGEDRRGSLSDRIQIGIDR